MEMPRCFIMTALNLYHWYDNARCVGFSGIFYWKTGTFDLWKTGINGIMGSPLYWLNITFGQYGLLIIGVVYLLCAGTSVFAFILSRFSKNIMLLLFKTMPAFIPSLLLSNWVLSEFLNVFDDRNMFIRFFVFALSLIAGMGAALFVMCREKKVEIL